MREQKRKDIILSLIGLGIIVGLFFLVQFIPNDFMSNLGKNLPLPLFTLIIGLVDGFNPCNLFVLTVLLGLLVSASHSRKKIYIIGYTFIGVVYIIYFLFMAAWLQVFKYIGFVDPLRIVIAVIAIGAGLINMKELFFFRKWITLMIQEKNKKPLLRRIDHMKEVINKGSVPLMIAASASLAFFASLVELPCTAGFPIIYTGILSGVTVGQPFLYYLYLLLYNVVYVLPLVILVTLFGTTLRSKQITKHQMQVIKFIGGSLMFLLGLILLFNPSILVG